MDRDEQRRRWQSFMVPAGETYQQSCWQPPVDVYRGRDGWLVKCDLAGVRPDDIEVRAGGRRLTIAGVRRDMSIVEGQQAYSMEIAYNRFERSLELPCDLESFDIETDYRDGMLLIMINAAGSEST